MSELIPLTLAEASFLAPWAHQPMWLAWAIAGGLGVLGFLLYFRESRKMARGKYLLPLLRALAIALVFLTLAQPVWRSVEDGGRRRCVVLIDRSASMGLSDRSMPVSEKLEILKSIGKEVDDPLITNLARADTGIEDLLELIDRTIPGLGVGEKEEKERFASAESIANAIESLKSPLAGFATRDPDAGKDVYAEFRRELLDRSRKDIGLWERRVPQVRDEVQLYEHYREKLAVLQPKISRRLHAASTAPNSQVAEAISYFDQFSRWRRVLGVMTPEDGILSQIAAEVDLEVWTFSGEGEPADLVLSRLVGEGTDEVPKGLSAARKPDGGTDLASVLRSVEETADPSTAVLVVSDGGHGGATAGGSPEAIAGELGELGVAVHTLGLGAIAMQGDVAILGVEAPESCFIEDEVAGSIVISDGLRDAHRFRAVITDRSTGKDLWMDELDMAGLGEREIAFRIPLKEHIELDPDQGSAPLLLEARLEPLDAAGNPIPDDPAASSSVVPVDQIRDNNRWEFGVQADARRRSLVVLAGRARWEIRYVDRLFRRHPGWDVEVVFADAGSPYPGDRELIEKADVVLLGELPGGWLPERAKTELETFVGDGGGGLILLDGKRGNLARHSNPGGTLADLVPVRWNSTAGRSGNLRSSLTIEGRENTAFQLGGVGDSDELDWSDLPEVRWAADTVELAGSVRFAEARMAGAGAESEAGASALMTARRFGGGMVIHVGTDEIWRWRFGRGNEIQSQFWMQLIQWAGGEPFQVSGEKVDIGVSKVISRPGESVPIRARIHSTAGDGGFVEGLQDVIARVTDPEGKLMGEYALEPAGNSYRGVVPALPEDGAYSVHISSKTGLGSAKSAESMATIRRFSETNTELARPQQRVGFLKSLATRSGGSYIPESEARTAVEVVMGKFGREVEVKETAIWNHWLWFLVVIVLLTIEWLLRKRYGMV